MSYYNDDFYDEPSEFDQQIDEFKQSLLKMVKTDFITKMERLEKENTELRVIKKDFDQIKRDYENKERQLINDRSDMERKIKNERLSILMKDFELIMYVAKCRTEMLPKCDKCDDGRNVKYITPLGRSASEACECSAGNKVYSPEEYQCSQFKVDHDNKDLLLMWYRQKYDPDNYSYTDSRLAEEIYHEGMKFEDIAPYYHMYFKSKEECQKYCDWLTEKEQNKGVVNQ